MKTSTLITAALAANFLYLFASSAVAKETGVTASPEHQERLSANQSYRMSAFEYDNFRGPYSLQDGRTLRLSRQRGLFLAEIAGQPKLEITPVSATHFVAAMHGITLRFEQFPNGEVAGVELTQQVNRPR